MNYDRHMKRIRRQHRREGVNRRLGARLAGGVISAERTPVNPPAATGLVSMKQAARGMSELGASVESYRKR